MDVVIVDVGALLALAVVAVLGVAFLHLIAEIAYDEFDTLRQWLTRNVR